MDLLKAPGQQLANYLCVDRTLVSKWKNNARPFSANSTYFDKVVEYFLIVNSKMGSNLLEQFLKQIYPGEVLNSYIDLKRCLTKWLSNNKPANFTGINPDTNRNDGLYSANFTVFTGDTGRREAVINFLDTVLTHSDNQDILLISKENMSWVFDDKGFTKIWQQKLFEILSRNHKIHIIHYLNRDVKTLVSSIQTWLPLYFTGNLTSYFNPSYIDDLEKYSLFIIKNNQTIFGMEAKNNKKDRYTALFKDSVTQSQMEWLFYSNLKKCKLLNEIYKLNQEGISSLMERLISLGDMKEQVYLYTKLPMFVTMDIDTLTEVLDENDITAKSRESCLYIYNKINYFYQKGINSFFCRNFYDLNSLKSSVDVEYIYYNDLSVLTGQEIKVSNKHFKSHIKSIIKLLEKYKLYEVALIQQNQYPIPLGAGIWVKQHSFAYAYPQYMATHHTLISEVMLIDAFFYLFDNIWNSIPKVSKEKDKVILELEKLTK